MASGTPGRTWKSAQGCDVVAFRHFLVQDSVAVKEDGGQVARNGWGAVVVTG